MKLWLSRGLYRGIESDGVKEICCSLLLFRGVGKGASPCWGQEPGNLRADSGVHRAAFRPHRPGPLSHHTEPTGMITPFYSFIES